MKQIFFDTETTGLKHEYHSMVTLSGIIVIDGEEKERFNYTMRPYRNTKPESDALIANHLTEEQIMSFDDPKEILNDFIAILDKYYDGEGFTPVGYNVRFDINYMRDWFKFCGSNYDKYFLFRSEDVYLMVKNDPSFNHLPNRKLTTIYKDVIGEELEDSHTSMADINATKRLYDYFYEEFKKTS